MARFVALAVICGLLLTQVGCVAVATPAAGSIFTNVKGPIGAVDNSVSPSKRGEATAQGIIGIVTGDASIKAAMEAGGITKVHHVDMEATNILSIYGTFKTVVYGE